MAVIIFSGCSAKNKLEVYNNENVNLAPEEEYSAYTEVYQSDNLGIKFKYIKMSDGNKIVEEDGRISVNGDDSNESIYVFNLSDNEYWVSFKNFIENYLGDVDRNNPKKCKAIFVDKYDFGSSPIDLVESKNPDVATMALVLPVNDITVTDQEVADYLKINDWGVDMSERARFDISQTKAQSMCGRLVTYGDSYTKFVHLTGNGQDKVVDLHHTGRALPFYDENSVELINNK